ncbi:MAG TPA: VanZ family protein [Clostridia bacterium]
MSDTRRAKNRNLLINLLMAIVSLIIGLLLCSTFSEFVLLLGLGQSSNLTFFCVIFTIACILFFVFRSLIGRKFDKPVWIVASVLYVTFLIAVLFLKDHMRGINLDLRGFFDQWNGYNRNYLIGNFLAFIPYPLVLYFWGLKTKLWRAVILFLAIEGLQYVLSVGVFDVYDLVPYVLGYLTGCLILLLYRRIGVQSAYDILAILNIKKNK